MHDVHGNILYAWSMKTTCYILQKGTVSDTNELEVISDTAILTDKVKTLDTNMP